MRGLPVALLVVSAVLYSSVQCEEMYTSKFDNIDLDEIFKSDRLISNYMDCFMDRGHCTPQGTEIRKHIDDGIQSKCSKCTDKQKSNIKKVLNFMFDERPKLYAELETKYDPDHKYKSEAESFRKKP